MNAIEPQDLAAALRDLNQWASANAPVRESQLRKTIREHFGADPAEFPVVSRAYAAWERANLQLALDAYVERPNRTSELIGLSAQRGWHVGLAELAQRPQRGGYVGTFGSQSAPQEHVTVQIGDRTIVCVASGLFLIDAEGTPIVACIGAGDQNDGRERLSLQVMSADRDTAERFFAELTELMHAHNVYRGRIIEVGGSSYGGATFEVRDLPSIERSDIVLPDGLLERIERHTIGFSKHAAQMRDAGRHIGRGLLLHGPPGTGKTLTAKFLANTMTDRTVLILTGDGLHAIDSACAMARSLAPSMVVLEDVDLVALDRDEYESSVALFDLLNEMDGMRTDVDVVFVLTTNRPDRLEPALAARPGRVDLAAELPLPDDRGRARLIDLYSDGIDLRANDLPSVVARTEGASPAFIRELLRRATLLAAEDGGDRLIVEQRHVDAALAELESDESALTSRLLGIARPSD